MALLLVGGCASGSAVGPPDRERIPDPPPAERPPEGPRREGVEAPQSPRRASAREAFAYGRRPRGPSAGESFDDDAFLQEPQDDKKDAAASRDAAIAEQVKDQTSVVTQPPDFEPMRSRWFINPPPYEINDEDDPFNPYRRNRLKGDFPIIGEDVFLNLTFINRTIAEARELPVPRGNTGPIGGVQPSFFGDGEQFQVFNFSSVTVDLFKGQQAFKPVDWRLRMTPVLNVESLQTQEVGLVNVNAAHGKHRTTGDAALQEAFGELHLFDFSDRYDFMAVTAGIQPFRSDFRGFIFDETQLGVRLFANADDNKWQFNLAAFRMLEKDTRSELNTFDDRDQHVLVANVYRQDWPVLGYTTQASFHWNHDDGGTYFDRNGFLVRPAPVGFASEHEVDAYYLGVAGEGHFGRLNLTNAFYYAFGEDDRNPFAARDVDISAFMAAVEASYDVDWARFRAFAMFASGDDDPRDGRATGFDAIVDAPNFAGGELSYFHRQAIRLLGVGLSQRLSPLPDLSSAKFEGQANFVNPGLLLIGGAFDAEITPKLRAQIGASWLRFVETEPLEIYLETEGIDEALGVEVFFGAQWRPLLTNNVNVMFGAAALFPGDGFEKMYQTNDVQWQLFVDLTLTW